MKIYKISDSIAEQYHGGGYALAVVSGGQVVRLVYLDDALPDFDSETDHLGIALVDERLAPTVRELSVLGEVCIGTCWNWEFAVF